MQFIGRLALEALQLRNIQRGILRSNELVVAHVDGLQRSHCLLEIVAAIKHLGEHDLRVDVTRLENYGPFQAFLRIVKPVGKQCNATRTGGLPNSPWDFEWRFASKVCQLRQTSQPERADRPNRFLIAWAGMSLVPRNNKTRSP